MGNRKNMDMSSWNLKSLKARIKDSHKRIRYEAGSPNREEIELYRRFLVKGFQNQNLNKKRKVVVLGMTPELRNLAHEMDCSVVCIDNNLESIRLLRNWVSTKYIEKEIIIQANWLALINLLERPVDCILGDGVFGNVLSLDEHKRLLRAFKSSLGKNGILILRKILIPGNFCINDHEAEKLLERFRLGDLTEAEFGFGMRIWGSYRYAFNQKTFILDNKVVFNRYKNWLNKNLLSDYEFAIIQRYCFEGWNLIPPQDIWEALLENEGFAFETRLLNGKTWYEYYPLYYCYMKSDG